MSWFYRLIRRAKAEDELKEEIQFYLDQETQLRIDRGQSPIEAKYAARRDFGNVALVAEEVRKMWGWNSLERLAQDLRYGLRTLLKSPGFAVAAVATLAFGIGANAAIFQLLDAVRLRTLPVKDPQQLAVVELADRTGWRGEQATPYPALTNPLWERFRDTQDAFSGALAWGGNNFNLAAGGEARLARGLFVSGDFFRVLGVEALLGRVFTTTEDQRGCGLPGAVISYSFWQREFGGDASIIGRKILLNFQQVEVIGVTPAGFTGLEVGRSFDVAVPICSQAVLWNAGNWLDEGTVWWLTVMGRLKPGATLGRTNAQLRAASTSLFQASLPSNYPAENVKDYLKFRLQAVPAGSGVSQLRSQYGDSLLLLLATTALVLLIACANLANLILARASAREREFAIRLAIGASRGRLVQQLMVESSLLAAAGAVAGFLLSRVLSRFLVALLSTQGNPLFLNLELDWRILAFVASIATVTCILFGLTPALTGTRMPASESLRAAGRTLSLTRNRFGLRQTLVVSQVALSLVLLVSALLFSGSLRNLLAVDAGFQHDGLLITYIDMSRLEIPEARRLASKTDLLERIRAVPGVTSAGEVGILPLSGGLMDNGVWMDGASPRNQIATNFNVISEGYLKTMGITLLTGRDFNQQDTVTSPRVAIVNQSFVHRFGITGDPIGRRFRRQATPRQPELIFEIVGLVRDTKYRTLREEFRPIAFMCAAQDDDPSPFAQFVVRSTVPLAATTSGVRNVISQASPLVEVSFASYETTVREGLMRERLMATLSGFFGVLAAVIAAVGLYGVTSYLAVRRTNEIGVRIALGAGRRTILALIMGEAARVLTIGLALGMLLALAVARSAQSMLFGLKPYDGGTIMLAAVLLTAVATLASYLPARRAARLDPMVALREE